MSATSKKGGAAPTINEILGTLQGRRKRLDDADTRISDKLKEAEKLLQDHFNTRVWAMISSANDGTDTKIVFGKHDGKWQLLIETEGFGDHSITPLLSCSREMRARVFTEGSLETLIRGAVDQLDEQLKTREEAIDKAEKLVIELGGLPF